MSGGITPGTARGRAEERSHAWQRRRLEHLREACTYIAEQIAGGIKTLRAIKNAQRRFRNRSVGNGRQLDLSAKSMERHWYAFKERGDAAFALRYVANRKHEIDPLLLHLVINSSIRHSKSISEILIEAGGGGDRKGRASLATIYRALPTKEILQFLRAEKRLIAQRKNTERKLIALTTRLRELRVSAKEKFLSQGDAS